MTVNGIFNVYFLQVKQMEFREKFQMEAPFSYNSKTPYILLDKVGALS